MIASVKAAKLAQVQGASPEQKRRRFLLVLLLVVGAIGVVASVTRANLHAREIERLSLSELLIAAHETPKDVPIQVELAERFLWEERNEDALRAAGKALLLDPRNARAYYLLGKTYQRLSEAKAGINALNEAVRLDPNYPEAHFLLGHGYYWHEEPLLASRHFEKYVQLQPADDIGYRFLGLAWLRLGKLDAAERALQRSVELQPDSSGNHQALGTLYLNRATGRGDLDRAAEHLLKAVELNPRADSNHTQAAMALQRLGRLSEAADQYEIVLAKTPTDEKVCYALLQLSLRLKDIRRTARYRELYTRIIRARDASTAITAPRPGEPSYPTR